MATYNFTDGGKIYLDDVLHVDTFGPTTLTPRILYPGSFTLSYDSYTEVYDYVNNTYEINGVAFVGTLAAFCTAAGLVIADGGVASSGGGESYADVDANTTATIDDTKALTFQTGGFYELLKLESDTAGGTTHKETLGDHNATAVLTEYSDGTADFAVGVTGLAGKNAGLYAGGFDGFAEAQVYATGHTFKASDTGYTFSGTGAALFNNTGGLKLPEVTKAQRNALDAYAGFAVYQTDNTPGLRVFNGTNWVKFTETTDA